MGVGFNMGLYLPLMTNQIIIIPVRLYLSWMSARLDLTILKTTFTDSPLSVLCVYFPITFMSTSVGVGLAYLCLGNTDRMLK